MKMKSKIAALGILAMGMAANSNAQSTATASTTATLLTPISIKKDVDMNFGTLAASGTAGTVQLDYIDGRTASTGVKLLSGTTPATAVFTVTGEGTNTFSISIPSSIVLKTTGGAELIVDGITCEQGASSALVTGTKTLKVKATLQVKANAVAGTYQNASDLYVTVNYN